MKVIYGNKLDGAGVGIIEYGMQSCLPGHSRGPALRGRYIIHFAMGGEGLFQSGSNRWHVKEGQGFVIYPDIMTYYKADLQTPWDYKWIGFYGEKVPFWLEQAGICPEHPVFDFKAVMYINNCFSQAFEADKLGRGKDLKLLSVFFSLLSCLAAEKSQKFAKGRNLYPKDLYVQNMTDFIRTNYANSITLKDIAGYIGLESKYVCRLFKEQLGISPYKYLTQVRMEKACELARGYSLSIGDIARSVGYEDPLVFSRVFKKLQGVSPREYKKGG